MAETDEGVPGPGELVRSDPDGAADLLHWLAFEHPDVLRAAEASRWPNARAVAAGLARWMEERHRVHRRDQRPPLTPE